MHMPCGHLVTGPLVYNVASSRRYAKGGQLAVAGFCDPVGDAGKQDLDLWRPPSNGGDMDREQVQYLGTHKRYLKSLLD